MMKLLCWILTVLPGLLVAEELETRAYRAEMKEFEYFTWSGPTRGADGKRVNLWEGEQIQKAPFESRFFRAGDELLDLTAWGQSGGMFSKKGTAAIYNVRARRLVVKGTLDDHHALEASLGRQFSTMLRSNISLFSVPGVTLGNRARGVEEGELLADLTCLHSSGQMFEASSKRGRFQMEGGSVIDSSTDLIDSWIHLRGKMNGGDFSLRTGLVITRGVSQVMEIGSLDGQSTVVAVLNQKRVLLDGTLLDEWILKEVGGAFLREERLAGKPQDEQKVFELGKEVRGFRLKEVFLNFLNNDPEDDPFAEEVAEGPEYMKFAKVDASQYSELADFQSGEFYDVSELLKRNRVEFREGDFAIYEVKRSMVFAKASRSNLALIDVILNSSTGPSMPRLIRVDFAQVERVDKMTTAQIREGEMTVVKTLSALVSPGHLGKITLGEELVAEVEAHVDWHSDLIELRATLSESGSLEKAAFKTGLVLPEGKPLVVQQSRRGDQWVAWVATANVISVGGEAE